MDAKDWLILKTIADEKNITKAAERLYISQPALTYRLKNMEKEFGAKFVSRSHNGIVLTHQGEFMLAYANEMLERFQDTKERIKNMENKVQGTLRLGSSSIFAHHDLPNILKNFLQIYPDVDVILKTGMSARIYRMLQKEEITVAILRGDYPWAEEKHQLRDEPICLVSSEPLEFKDLPGRTQITYATNSSLKPLIENWWREFFTEAPRATMDVDSMDTCRQMVLHGLGWSVLPATGLSEHENLHIKELYWRSGKPLRRSTWLMYYTSSLELITVKTFADYLLETQRMSQ